MKDPSIKQLFRDALEAGEKRNYRKAIALFSSVISQTDGYPEALLYLGRSYHSLGEYERAVTILKHFINRRPDISAGYFFLGRSYCALHQYAHAVRALKRGRQRDRDNPHIESFLGLSYLKLKKLDKAVAFLERAVNLAPDNASIYTGYLNALTVKGVKLFHNGDMDMAGQIFRFLEEAGDGPLLSHVYLGIIERELGNLDDALEHTERAIAQSGDPLLILRKANLLLQAGRNREAASCLETVKKEFPEFQEQQPAPEDLGRFLAMRLFNEKQFVKAIYHARKVLRRDPSVTEMHMLIGEGYRNLGEFEKAGNHFKMAAKKERHLVEPHLGSAMVYWQTENYKEVLQELDKIEARDRDHEIVQYYRALCKSRLEYPCEETLSTVQEALRRYGPDLFLMNTLGNEYLRCGLPDLAEKWFKKSITLAGSNTESQLGLIKVYQEMGREKEEITALRNYLKHEPADLESRKKLIHLLMDRSKYKEAEKEILRHDAYGRKEKSFQGLLALCYMKTGRYIDAAVLYRQMLRKDPENVRYLRGLIYCYDKSGNTKNAVFFLEKALGHIKPTLSLSLILGVLKYKDGDADGALKWFRNALSMSRNDWRAYQNIGIIYKRRGISEFAEMFLSRAEELKNAVKA